MNQLSNEEIIGRFELIESRIAKLEGSIFAGQDPRKVLGSNKSKSRKSKGDLKTPISNLVESGFFQEFKTDLDVLKKLKQQVLNPRRSSVSNVLRSFASPKHELLQREGGGTKSDPWRYKRR